MNDYEKAVILYKNDINLNTKEVSEKFNIDCKKFKLFCKNSGIEIRKTGNRKYNFNHQYFDQINTEEKAYWLGFILADGCISKNLYNMHIQLQQTDKAHLEKFAKIFNVPIKIGSSYDKRNGNNYQWCNIKINSNYICKSLNNKGVTPRKSLLDCSIIFEYIPNELIHHFIRGYFDGDGFVGVSNKDREYAFVLVGNDKFLQFIRDNVFTKELNLNINNVRQMGTIYRLAYGGNFQLVKIRNWLYKDATIWLERKKNLFDKVEFGGGSKIHSKLRGVTFHKKEKKWQAQCTINRKNTYIGQYKTELEAAKAYNNFVIKNNLPKSRLNIL